MYVVFKQSRYSVNDVEYNMFGTQGIFEIEVMLLQVQKWGLWASSDFLTIVYWHKHSLYL